MKQDLWRACKFLIPAAILYYSGHWVYNAIEGFWWDTVLYRFNIFIEGEWRNVFLFLATAILTVVLLLVVGRILRFKFVKMGLDFIARHIPLLKYFWSGGEDAFDDHRITPVLFQHPMAGQWKIGFIMGDQKLDDGKEFYRVFFITGVGDHEFIDKSRPDLIIPLANSAPEVMQFVASFMASGPKVLKKKNGPVKPPPSGDSA